METYQISQLAERSGVPATTLRYYEAAGLLPAERTPSGYRVYDEASARRLEFIASAKTLGLALEEIRDLLGAWDSGVCAHVRDRMVPLIDQRIGDADRRSAEIAAFSARLAQARAELSTPAPEGACGPGCGCVAGHQSGPVPVALGPPPSARDDAEAGRAAPTAGTLTSAETADRVARWRQLLIQASGCEETPDGVRVTFPAVAGLAGAVAGLASAEQDRYPSFDFTLHLAPGQVELAVRAPEAAAPRLADLSGHAS